MVLIVIKLLTNATTLTAKSVAPFTFAKSAILLAAGYAKRYPPENKGIILGEETDETT